MYLYTYMHIFFMYVNNYGIRERSGKTTAIRRVAVRETSVSRHHGDLDEGTLKPSVHYSTLLY